MHNYHVKINGVPLTELSQFQTIIANEPIELEIIFDTGSKFVSQKYTGKIRRSGDTWFKFYYNIEQNIRDETINGLDFNPCLNLMIWNDGYESGKLLVEVK